MSITGEHAGKLHQLRRPTFTELYLPKLVTVWREGYGLADFRADVFAGLTVAIVALPLSMAIAIASGVTPDRGLYTAVVGGFIASLLGGSRFQIGGPAGAFIVLVAATANRHGVDGVILATLLAGLLLIRRGIAADRHLHQVHSLSSDGRLHRRHCGDHLRKPAARSRRHHACRKGAQRIRPETRRAGWRPAHRQSVRRRDRNRQHRHHRRLATLAAVLARHPDRGRVRGGRERCTVAAGRDHRQPLRRHSARIAVTGAARVLAGEGECGAARRNRVRAACRNRIAAVGRGGRRHDRTPSPLQFASWSRRALPISVRRCSAASASPA